MSKKEEIKNTGATFTPFELANFLAESILKYIDANYQNILDPACGEGELLFALGEKMSERKIKYRLSGYDSNSHYLKNARDRFFKLNDAETNFVQGDFLQAIDLTSNGKKLDLFSELKSGINENFDIVIANPPYVRTQILGSEQAQALARKFSLKGRVDLYFPFLIAMTESLKDGGILGVITSNRYLYTKSGESIRKFLSENYEIIELIDLGDTKIFNAAVLPAIFIGRKRRVKTSSLASFIKIYEDLNNSKEGFTSSRDIFEVLSHPKDGFFVVGKKRYKKSIGELKYSVSSGSSWEMFSEKESDWISKINHSARNRVEDFFKVRVGIKSTADAVFISDKWDDMGVDKPEEDLLKDLISQENIESWNATDNVCLKVLYPHTTVNGEKQTVEIEKYPNAMRYFFLHEEKLKSRKYLIEAGRKWYELWVSHKPNIWNFPKLVFPDISVRPRFYFDKGGKIVNGNCYWIVAKKEDDVNKLLLIQGVANSKLMTKYHDLVFGNKLYSGRRRYFSQYVEKYPLPDFNAALSKEIISIVEKLNQSVHDYENLERLLEIKVAESFGVDPVFTLD